MVKVYASPFDYKRSVDCEAMCFARGAPSRCSPLSANRVRTGDDVVVGSNLEPERGFCRTLRRDASAIVAGSGLACAIWGGSGDGW